ncbi:MAG: YitT family protein [Bacteroidales bacterium]|jgi:uncharacterized membrane-anchored protein YitT (DUF2179 family)|nr:YitT family protein [Bacteroidales bacterium]
MQNLLKTVKIYLIITIGLFINALGWTAFLIPAKIAGGGITGVSTLIYYATNFPIGISYFIINIVLIALSIKILGKNFGVKTIFSTVVLTIFLSVLQLLIKEPIITENFMSAVVGGILSGVGVGIVFTQGGSTGGTDILAMVINKNRNISPGKLILYFDIIIISSSFLIFHSIEKIVYGYVTMAVTAYAIDMVLTGANRTVQMFIFSSKYEQIAEVVSEQINRGITILNGQGWFSKKEAKILLVIVRKQESNHVLQIIKDIDPDAFISLGSVMGVYGYGFDRIKGKKNKKRKLS